MGLTGGVGSRLVPIRRCAFGRKRNARGTVIKGCAFARRMPETAGVIVPCLPIIFFHPYPFGAHPRYKSFLFRGRPIRTPSIYNLPDRVRIKRRLFGRVVVYYYFKYTAIYYHHSTCSSLCCNRDCILSGQQFLPG